jgi:hypothetical protein
MKIVNPSSPVNFRHPLNKGRIGWWMRIPNSGWSGGLTFRDLVRGNRKPNNGTLVNGPIWQGSKGRIGGYGSLKFSSSLQTYVSLSPSLFTLGNTFSFGGWFYISNTSTRQYILGQNDAANTWQMDFNSAGGDVGVFIPGFGYVAETNINILTANTWAHIIYTRNGTGATHAIYLNGVSKSLVGANDATAFVNDTSSSKFIGQRNSAFVSGLNDAADDISLWNRALSAVQVRAIFEQSRRGHPNTLNWISQRAFSVLSQTVTGGTIFRRNLFLRSGSRGVI